jgi:alpha-tubulin suppressor-like RCC1 family protein
MISISGSVYVWGNNSFGQLGLGHTENIHTPVPLQIKKSVHLISCGGHHTIILLSDNSLFSFGKGDRGQLAHKEKSSKALPHKIDLNLINENIIEISCGFAYSVLLTDKQRIYVTGANEHGQLGIENGNQDISEFFLNDKISDVEKISCGYYHTSSLLQNGELYCWGSSEFGIFFFFS